MRTKGTRFLVNTEGLGSESSRGCARWTEYHTETEDVSGQSIP